MKENKCDFLVSKRQFRLLSFKEKIHVLNNFNTYNLNVLDKLALINSLPSKVRLEELICIFKCYELYQITKEELIIIYSKLNYQDKIYLLDTLSYYQFKKDLLDTLTEKEIYNFFNSPPICSNKEIRDYLASKLSPTTSYRFFNKLPTKNHTNQKISLLKNIPESFINQFIEKNKRRLARYKSNYSEEIQEIFAAIISMYFTEEEKIACLNKTNKYDLNLTDHERHDIIKTLSDDIKLKIIAGSIDCYYQYDSYGIYDRKKICKTLSDKTLISLINNQDFINENFEGEVYNIISLLSPSSCQYLLNNRPKYLCLYKPENFLTLIKGLPQEEKKELLKPNNKYHMTLTIKEMIELIKTFSNEEKIKIFNENPLNFELDNLEEIILSVDTSILINYLLTGKLNVKTVNTLSKIINYLSKISFFLLKSHNLNIQEFINRHRKIIINNMNIVDQIGIFKHPESYALKPTDDELITILIDLSESGYDGLECDFLSRFKNPDYFVEQLLNNMSNFNAIDDKNKKELISYYAKKHHYAVDENLIYQILKYNKNSIIIFKNYCAFNNFFTTLNINLQDFIQYGINSHKANYLEIILSIINHQETNKFKNLLTYLFINFYHIPNNSRDIIQAFLEVIRLYHLYPQLSDYIIEHKNILTLEDYEELKYLLKQNSPLKNIHNFNDIKKQQKKLLKDCYETIEAQQELTNLRNKLSQLLFSRNYQELTELLTITGREEDLEILKFNNRHNKYFTSFCDDLLIVTNLIEQIISIKDISTLKTYLLYFTNPNNYEQTKIISNYCSKYEENIRKLYEIDINLSLTNISQIPNELTQTKLAIKYKRKYGGQVIDLSNSNYVLGAHIKSDRETIENLINGISDGSQNYISLSSVSHRNQQYYYNYRVGELIFAYDSIPDNSFICSAGYNLGSNCSLHYNTLELPSISRHQKGVLEISQCDDVDEQNSEILLYREKLRPCGLIIPLGTKPSKESIKYHHRYKLPFIITQEVGATISNPKRLAIKNEQIPYVMANDEEIMALRKLEHDLSLLAKNNHRKIAIITDPHALYEPTLAALLDIKHQGINEIYSLGDNIGHGPNPKEVLDLLDRFNVKSVYGNHEIYLKEQGLKNFEGHFPSEESIERTLNMLKWIRQELTERDIEKINNYPERYELNIEGKQPLTLIHTTSRYTNNGKYAVKPQIIPNSYVIQGHEHFASKNSEQDIILRGVGIGQNVITDGMASYAIVEIKDDGYNLENHYVNYNRYNLLHTINESTMPSSAKHLIRKWVGK